MCCGTAKRGDTLCGLKGADVLNDLRAHQNKNLGGALFCSLVFEHRTDSPDHCLQTCVLDVRMRSTELNLQYQAHNQQFHRRPMHKTSSELTVSLVWREVLQILCALEQLYERATSSS
jgi:hypothetical protein